jgi:hypothetical protein
VSKTPLASYGDSRLTTHRHVPLGPSTRIPGRVEQPGGYRRQWLRPPSDTDAGKPIVFILRFRSRGNNKYPSPFPLDRADFSVEALVALNIIEDNTQEPNSESEDNSTTPNQQLEDQTLEDYYLNFDPDASHTPSKTPGIKTILC